MEMPTYFNTDLPITVAFSGWVINDVGTLTGSCFGVGGLAILFEIIKIARQIFWLKYSKMSKKSKSKVSPGNLNQDRKQEHCKNEDHRPLHFWGMHFLQSILQCIQVFLGYLLMLMVMTYNVWLVVSIIVGLSVGYFISYGIPWAIYFNLSDNPSSDVVMYSNESVQNSDVQTNGKVACIEMEKKKYEDGEKNDGNYTEHMF